MRASTIGHYNLAVGHGAITAWRRGSAVGILEWDIAMHDAIVRAAQSNDHHRRVHGVVAVIELADEACDRSHTALDQIQERAAFFRFVGLKTILRDLELGVRTQRNDR